MVSDITMQRLAFIRYLYGKAVEESMRPEPLNAASILTFHDSVELFLQVASEHLDVGGRDRAFMQYWELLKPKLPNDGLMQKEAMRRLNRSRVALKHHGTLPSKLDIEAFRASSTSFFEDNTALVFGIDFHRISMLHLVEDADVRATLERAHLVLAEEDDIESALDDVALAFAQLIDGYEGGARNQYRRSPFFFGRSLTFETSFFLGIEDRRFAEFVDKVGESIETMQSAIKMLSLGIEYRRYVRFRLLTPHLTRYVGGEYRITPPMRERSPTLNEYRFCYDFVIESAMHLQAFDFDLGV